jgi:hypothetical protein
MSTDSHGELALDAGMKRSDLSDPELERATLRSRPSAAWRSRWGSSPALCRRAEREGFARSQVTKPLMPFLRDG